MTISWMKTRGSEEITLREGLGLKSTEKIFRFQDFEKEGGEGERVWGWELGCVGWGVGEEGQPLP